MQNKLPTNPKALEKNIAKNNARIRKAVMLGIKMLDNGTRDARKDELKNALQAIADNICTKPPGCDPEPES